MNAPSRVVYRALVGGYEELREEPVAHETDIPFICLTDDPDLTSETWTIVLTEPRMSNDHTRSARALKILGHPCLADYDQTLWVDNTVELLRPPDELFDKWLDDADVAAPLHSFRDSVLGEAEAVVNAGYDDFARVYEQMTHYLTRGSHLLEENPHWTGILARRQGAVTTAAMQSWWEQVLRYSRRDQLSFVVAMRSTDARLTSVPIDNAASEWHRWPRARGRDQTRLSSGLREALRPPASRVGELELALDEAARNLASSVTSREQMLNAREQELNTAQELLAQRERTIQTIEGQLHETRGRVAALEAELASSFERRAALRRRLRKTRARERLLHQRIGRTTEKLRQVRRQLRRLQRQREPALARLRRRMRELRRRA